MHKAFLIFSKKFLLQTLINLMLKQEADYIFQYHSSVQNTKETTEVLNINIEQARTAKYDF